MQMYGVFDGFPLQWCIVWVGNIMAPVWANHSQVVVSNFFFNVFTRTLGKISMFDDCFFCLKGV